VQNKGYLLTYLFTYLLAVVNHHKWNRNRGIQQLLLSEWLMCSEFEERGRKDKVASASTTFVEFMKVRRWKKEEWVIRLYVSALGRLTGKWGGLTRESVTDTAGERDASTTRRAEHAPPGEGQHTPPITHPPTHHSAGTTPGRALDCPMWPALFDRRARTHTRTHKPSPTKDVSDSLCVMIVVVCRRL